MSVSERQWQAAVDALKDAPAVALACHVDPDGDALGSMLALHLCLERLGAKTLSSWGTSRDESASELIIPAQYAFLPALDRVVVPAAFPAEPAVMVAFDTGTAERLGSLQPAAAAAGTLVVVDHHASGQPFGDVRIVDATVAATAVLVDQLIGRLGVAIDRDMAICLYTALVTDTGRFQYASTTPAVLELAARLLALDIDHAAINRQVWETHSFGYIKLLSRVLERTQLIADVGLVWTVLTQADLERFGVAWQETESLIDVLRSVEVAEVALIAKEQSDGSWKVSLRSRGGVDAGGLARSFGGGGHHFLAGFLAPGPVGRIVSDVAAKLDSGPGAHTSAPASPEHDAGGRA